MIAYRTSLIILLFLTAVISDKPHVALKFGDDKSSYIMIAPDMSPLEEQVSICAWIKKLSPTSNYGVWLHYHTRDSETEILFSENFNYAYFMSGNIPKSQTHVHSEWYHICITWSYSSGKKTLFYNGVQIGTASSRSGRKLSLATGYLVIGQYHITYKMEAWFRNGNSFGGEITKLNILKRELTEQEVAKMYKSGICSSFEETLETDTHLSWEMLLSDDTEKHGNIVKLNLTCPDHTHEPTTGIPTTAVPTTAVPTTAVPTTAVPTTAAPTEESEGGCNNRWAILRLSEFYNKEVTATMMQDLRERWELLAEFEGHVIDDSLISHLKEHHCTNEQQ
ncbi:C-reactive protein 1.4-like [Bolinopsis microptera]|uniref:C-reactive protein 1.4-like n=1 Tax=Bolinopsis microptera TaxID=2820187 RepID=UPI003079F2E6